MPRNLDLTALRSFVTVAETGGVTRAAGFLNLTQSAVSMQLKRLEESLGLRLLDRSARSVALTAEGAQLLGYAKKMLELNDEAWQRLTCKEFEGEITLGVPHDIVYPAIPKVLARFASAFPRVKVQLVSSYTSQLKNEFRSGKYAMILTTEFEPDKEGETLVQLPLSWVGTPGTQIWRNRPLKVAFGRHCGFRPVGLGALDAMGIPWDMVIDSDSDRSIEATISADLGLGIMLDSTFPDQLAKVDHGGTLPELGVHHIALYTAETHVGPAATALADMLRKEYALMGAGEALKVA